jgi:tyrosinase
VCGYIHGTNNNTPWYFHEFLRDHILHDKEYAHTNPRFLPWHRVYLRELERRLQMFHPCVSLPYWDWTLDSGHEGQAHVFDTSYLGDANELGKAFRPMADVGEKLEEEAEAGERQAQQALEHVPTRPVRRVGYTTSLPHGWGELDRRGGDGEGDGKKWPFSDRSMLGALLSAKSYATFRTQLEGTPHAAPHVYIACHMSTMMAPSDPFFFLHHAMVDRIWDEWQNSVQYAWDFKNRRNVRKSMRWSYGGFRADFDHLVSPQWGSTRVRDVFDSRGQFHVCYTELAEDQAGSFSTGAEKRAQCESTKLSKDDLVEEGEEADVPGVNREGGALTVTATPTDQPKKKRPLTGMGAFAVRMGWDLEEFLEADAALHPLCSGN